MDHLAIEGKIVQVLVLHASDAMCPSCKLSNGHVPLQDPHLGFMSENQKTTTSGVLRLKPTHPSNLNHVTSMQYL